MEGALCYRRTPELTRAVPEAAHIGQVRGLFIFGADYARI